MENKDSKKINIIFIIWGLSISSAVIFLLIILLLAINERINPSSIIETQLWSIPQQETQTYNRIIPKINKKVDQLSTSPKINYQQDCKTISNIEEYDPSTGTLIKQTHYNDDGIKIEYIMEFDPSTGKKIKKTEYHNDGTIKKEKNY
jgi:hypothetical protein